MRLSSTRIGGLAVVLALGGLCASPSLARAEHQVRVKIDSQPPQAAIYVDSKEAGLTGYTPMTLKLTRGTHTIFLELPGFKPVQKAIQVTRAQAFLFPLERQARPAVLDVRSVAGDSATGGSLTVDGAGMGTVPARVEVQPGSHTIEVKKAGFKDFRDSVTVQEGETRSMVIDLQSEAKKGSILVTADVAGADVYVDGTRRDAAPALIGDLTEGQHTVEVRKDPLPPWKQVITVVGNTQTKVAAQLQQPEAQKGSLRIVSSTVDAHVFVDGEDKGPVNVEIKNLPPGQHIVEVRKQGFTPQTVEVQVVAGEQRLARIDLVAGIDPNTMARLRVVTPVPDAEVFVDGSSVGRAPFERNDLSPGKHYVVVRAHGYADWKREVELDPGRPTTLTAELSASGSLKILANVPGADVLVDGVVVGKAPATAENVMAGDHLVEVRATGYVSARQPVHVEGGEQKILSAELTQVRTGPNPVEQARVFRATSSFSAVTVEPARFTVDLAGGFFPFGQARLTVGAWRRGNMGVDAGVSLKTNGYQSVAGLHAKFQALRAGPVALGVDAFIGGGGGPTKRNTFEFEIGVPLSLIAGDVVRFTMHPYLQVYSDRNCPSLDDRLADPSLRFNGGGSGQEEGACELYDDDKMNPSKTRLMGTQLGTAMVGGTTQMGTIQSLAGGQDPRDRFTGARLMLQAVLEIAVHQSATIFFIFEGDPVGQRQAWTQKYSAAYKFQTDPQIYGRAGVTFKF